MAIQAKKAGDMATTQTHFKAYKALEVDLEEHVNMYPEVTKAAAPATKVLEPPA